jgi:isocitrate/methylisocitrate lyase
MDKRKFIERTTAEWRTSPRWKGIERPYGAEDVWRLRGSYHVEHTIARLGAERLWGLLHDESFVRSLSAVTGNQAIQHVRAGLKAIYVSGWQTAADANTASTVYPDLSLYPCDSVPQLVRRINSALLRADQIHHYRQSDQNGKGTYWLAPIVADAEAGFGGVLHAYEIMQAMIREGAAGVHFEDQLASVKKCGHLGGKVILPTQEFITKLVSARLAADVLGVDTLLVARTDAGSAGLLTSDIDPYDHEFLLGERTREGFYRVKAGLEQAISRGLAYAPYADLLWFETSHPELGEAQAFAEAIHERFPGKLLAYNCSPSFNWKANLSEAAISDFQNRLGAMGYKYQFVTLSGFHSLNHAMYQLAVGYRDRGMAAYSELQQAEFASEKTGYEAIKHQEFAGTGYFDAINEIASGGISSTLGMSGSTEKEQF